jgi:DNA-binding response OmpR family regulator
MKKIGKEHGGLHMSRHLVLILTSNAQRRDIWQTATRSAGHHAPPAHTLERALFFLSKVRPRLVLTDAELADGRVLALLRHLREFAPYARVVVVVFGDVTAEEHEHIAADTLTHVRRVDAPIGQILDELIAAA